MYEGDVEIKITIPAWLHRKLLEIAGKHEQSVGEFISITLRRSYPPTPDDLPEPPYSLKEHVERKKRPSPLSFLLKK